MKTQARRQILIEPIISYPREAHIGRSYLLSIDVRMLTTPAEWPYEQEEYPISFLLETMPLFQVEPVGEEDPAVVLHRFGGTYGPALFLLTAAETEASGTIRVILVNDKGVPIEQISVPSQVMSGDVDTSQGISRALQTRTQRGSDPAPATFLPTSADPNTLVQGPTRPLEADAVQDLDTLVQGPTRPLETEPTPVAHHSGAADPLGRLLHTRYKIVQVLSQDSFVSIYLARDISDNRIAAVHLLRPELAQESEFPARLQRAARILQGLDDPHIVHISDSGVDEEYHFLVLEYVDGHSLQYVLRSEGRLEARRALEYARQVAQGLQTAFAHTSIHRNLTPQNILINSDDAVKISGWLLARSDEATTLTEEESFLGTAYYAAPEQAGRPHTVDIRADLYSLAVILFEMLAGYPPFQGESVLDVLLKHMQGSIPSLSQVYPEFPAAFDRFFQRALAKAPDGRYLTPQEFLSALEHLQQALPLGEAATTLREESATELFSPPAENSQGAPGVGGFAGRYRLIDEYSTDSFATTYLGLDSENRVRLVKVMRPDTASDGELLARFQREIYILTHLTDPHIVRILDYGQTHDTRFLVTEYVDGHNLTYHLRTGPLPLPEALDYARQVAKGLDAAHQRRVVHRDIRPQNILITTTGVARITGFGLANSREVPSVTGEAIFLGTAAYIAPEQAEQAHAVDIRADLYSLAAVFFEMLAGRPPFEGDTVLDVVLKHVRASIPSLCQLRPDLPDEFDRFFQQALAKLPEQRYPTPQEFIQALAKLQSLANRPAQPAQRAPAGTGSGSGDTAETCVRCAATLRVGATFCSNCGTRRPQIQSEPGESTPLPIAPPEHEQAGLMIGHYQILQTIGMGSIGRVYLAEDVRTHTRVALKLVQTRLISSQAYQRLLQEMHLLRQLRHPHIVAIYEVGMHEGLPYIVTAYASQGSLRERIRAYAPGWLPLSLALRILQQIGEALHYMHRKQVIHRDIKPSNILLDSQDVALLADFGLAIRLDAQEETRSDTAGTPGYMAPEQFAGTASAQSDQYALGCVAYELVTGQRAFNAPHVLGMMWQQTQEQSMRPTELRPDLPAHIEQAILKALDKNPAHRHADVLAFLAALRRPSQARLVLIATGESFALTDEVILIGRPDPALGNSPQIPLPDKSVGRRHAYLRQQAGVFTIEDLNARNRTRVNGAIATPYEEYALADNDLLRFGEVDMRFERL